MDNAYRCQAGDISERARLSEMNKGDQLQLSLSGLCGNEGQVLSDLPIKTSTSPTSNLCKALRTCTPYYIITCYIISKWIDTYSINE